MNSAYLPALAALAGSAVGGLTSFASAWLTQHHQDRANRLSRNKARRQRVYKRFIDEASKLYADASCTIWRSRRWSASTTSRMRVLSSVVVVEKAESVVHMIVETYCAPNKTFPELRELMSSHAIDPLRAFSEECRTELQDRKDQRARTQA
jgi:hypothetical protein